MTQTYLARPRPSFPGRSERPSVPRVKRSANEYAYLGSLFTDLARLPEGQHRSALRDRLIIEHLPLARHIAVRFVRRGELLHDLEQVATVGLIHAVDRFDPNRGSEFLAFAIPTINGELQRWIRDHGWPMRVSRRLKELDASIAGAIDRLSQELGRAPRPSEIAVRLDVPIPDVIEGLQAHDARRCVSLDEPVGTEPDNEPFYSGVLGELDPDVALAEDREALVPLLDALPERERRIVLLRFFGNMTQTQIAREIGISQMHVSRLLTATLKKMRQEMTADT